MTPEEAATLQEVGRNIRQTFAAIVFKSIIFPLYALSVFKACIILRRKNFSPMLIINLAIIVILFLCALVLLSIDISSFAREVSITLIRNPDIPIDQKFAAANNQVFSLASVEDAIYAYMTILGDAIIIWRVHAFWNHGKRRWLLSILWALLLGSTVVDVLLTFCVAKLGTQIVAGAFQKPVFCKSIQTTSYAMPAATTLTATTMIGVTTWEYRRTIKPGLQSLTSMSRVEKVMLILVESGLLYFLFFLAQVINNTPTVSAAIFARENFGFADLVFSFSTSIIVGWYPTIVVLLAHSEHAVLDSVASSTWLAAGQISTRSIERAIHIPEENELSAVKEDVKH